MQEIKGERKVEFEDYIPNRDGWQRNEADVSRATYPLSEVQDSFLTPRTDLTSRTYVGQLPVCTSAWKDNCTSLPAPDIAESKNSPNSASSNKVSGDKEGKSAKTVSSRQQISESKYDRDVK